MKGKRKIGLLRVFAVEFIILTVVFALLLWAETNVTEVATEKKLRERAESISESFMTSYRDIHGIMDRYDAAIQARAESLAFLVGHSDEINEDNITELTTLFDVDAIYLVGSEDEIPDSPMDTLNYAAETSDGRIVVLNKNSQESEEVLRQYEENNAFHGYNTLTDDLYFVLQSKNHYIMAWPEEKGDYNYNKIDVIGIQYEDLDLEKGKWLTILGERYFTVSVADEEDNTTTVCAVSYRDMTKNITIALGVLYALIILIVTTLAGYSYFCRQEEQRSENESGPYSRAIVIRKMKIYIMVGLVLVALVTFYIQSLYSLSLNSMEAAEAKQNIQAALEDTDSKRSTLEKIYDRQYLDVAKATSYILSRQPELRTQEDLATLSRIFGADYIMLFDADGKETVSDSEIFDFEISDDPESQSYEFNALKHGVEYVIQEAQENELTGEHCKFIGVPLYNRDGEYDGFMQVCISPEDLEMVLDDVSLQNILVNKVAGSENGVLAIEKGTGNIACYTDDASLIGKSAFDLGMSEDQVRGNYLGYLQLDDKKLFADSFETAGYYMYVVISRAVLYSGRPTMVIFTVLVCFLATGVYTFWFKDKRVKDIEKDPESDPYLDVYTADDTKKRSLNIVARVYRLRTEWRHRTPEEKTARIIRIIVMFIGLSMGVAYLMRDYIYTEDTIFGFIMSNRWNRGFNLFSITNVMIFLTMYTIVMTLVELLLNQMVSVSSPKTETVMRILRSFVRYVGLIAAVYYSLTLCGVDSRSLLASAGILTLIVGLGAQDLITDILAGLFIIFENEFQVGDIIEVNGFKGTVTEIGIRSTRLINTRQDVKSVNNRNLTNIVNKTRRNSNCDILITVAFTEDINAIEAMLNEELPKIAEKCPYIISGPTYGGVDDMSGGDMVLSIRTECVESRKFTVRTVVNKEVKNLFDKYGFKLGG